MKGCEPLLATRRSKRRQSFVDEVAETAEKSLGFTLSEWQLRVLGTGLEFRVNGQPFFTEAVVVTVPRQQGKTIMMWALMLWWARKWPNQRIMYVAQTRLDAANRVLDLGLLLLQRGADDVQRYKGVGNEHLMFANGSRVDIVAPNATGLHGSSIDLAIADESWTLQPQVMSGLIPARAARPNSMLWFVSTQGTLDSEVFNGLCDKGREGLSKRFAYFEWAAGPDDDVFDPEAWSGWMPALGDTVSVQSVEAAQAVLSPSEFRRAFGNVITSTEDELIPDEWWSRSLAAMTVPPVAGSVYSFDVNYDPPGASVAYAFPTDEGFHVGIAHRESGEGGLWVPAFMDKVLNSRRPLVVGTAGGGAARSVAAPVKDACETRMIPYRSLGAPDLAASAMLFYELLREGKITHSESESLDLAVARSRSKAQGDQWRFDRKGMTVDSSPLVAVSLAVFLARDAALQKSAMFVA